MMEDHHTYLTTENNFAVVDQFTNKWKHPTQMPTVIKVLFCFQS